MLLFALIALAARATLTNAIGVPDDVVVDASRRQLREISDATYEPTTVTAAPTTNTYSPTTETYAPTYGPRCYFIFSLDLTWVAAQQVLTNPNISNGVLGNSWHSVDLSVTNAVTGEVLKPSTIQQDVPLPDFTASPINLGDYAHLSEEFCLPAGTHRFQVTIDETTNPAAVAGIINNVFPLVHPLATFEIFAFYAFWWAVPSEDRPRVEAYKAGIAASGLGYPDILAPFDLVGGIPSPIACQAPFDKTLTVPPPFGDLPGGPVPACPGDQCRPGDYPAVGSRRRLSNTIGGQCSA